MPLDELVLRTTLTFLLSLMLAYFIATSAHCEPLSLSDRLVSAQHLPGTQRPNEEHVDEGELAEAIVKATDGNRTLAALVLTMASTESGLLKRIADGKCKPRECDRGKAVGLWQSHFLERGAPLDVQANEAARELRRAVSACHGLSFPLAAMRAYGSGAGCHAPIPRETERVELFKRIQKAVL